MKGEASIVKSIGKVWGCWVRMSGSFPYLAEIHRLYSLTSKRRAHWRARRCLSCSYYQLHYLVCCRACLRHVELACKRQPSGLLQFRD